MTNADVPDRNVRDTISRQEAIDTVDEALTRVFVEHRDIAEKMINKIPSAQPERMKGKWISDEDGNIYCSVCGRTGVGESFCEHCGADMRGEENGRNTGI